VVETLVATRRQALEGSAQVHEMVRGSNGHELVGNGVGTTMLCSYLEAEVFSRPSSYLEARKSSWGEDGGWQAKHIKSELFKETKKDS
jgi:hypothetical protein